MRRVSKQEWENEHMHNPMTEGEALAVDAWNVLQIGARGSAYDPKDARRAFTYDHQPGNVVASQLGAATNTAANASAGDSIDRGLCLLKSLQDAGFGVFQIDPLGPSAAIAAHTAASGGEAVAEVGPVWSINWIGSAPIAEICRRHPELRIGSKLYTAPPAAVPVAELVALAADLEAEGIRLNGGADKPYTDDENSVRAFAIAYCASRITALAQKGAAHA